jgi:hypothetical protein
MSRQMFANGGLAMPPDQGLAMPPDQGLAMPPDQGMQGMQGMDPNAVDLNQAAEGAMQQGVDPQMLEGMLAEYEGSREGLDSAENYEAAINSIRGDELPLEQRYAELSEMVGPEDARATPESVLTLLQPVMLIAAVDQGIGGLAAEEMSSPIEGPMAEGIMSTVNMGAPEGPTPVNFSQGGAVQYFDQGGAPGRLETLYKDKQSVYGDILGTANQEAEFADQRNMTQAQMLFDVAQGALGFATPGDRNMSPAEKLAQSFQPVLGNISARAGELQKFQQGQKREKRALNLQALGSAEASLGAEKTAQVKKDLLESEQSWKTSESISQRAHEINKQTHLFNFNAGESSLGREHQTGLAQLKIDAQTTLANLGADNTTANIQLRARLQADLAKINHHFTKNLQDERFDFQSAERLSGQAYSDAVKEKQFANDKSLLAIQFGTSKQMVALKDQLLKENVKLEEEFKVSEATVAFGRALEKMGAANTFDIGKMEFGAERNKALATLNSNLAIERQEHEQAFKSAERVIAHAQQNNLTYSRLAFQAAMQEDMQSFQLEQSTIDRAIAKIDSTFAKNLALVGADQANRKIDLTKDAMNLEAAYKTGQLAITRMEAKNKRLGSEAKTATLSFLTNQNRLELYAQRKLSAAETTEFEQLVLDYTKPERVWNGEAYVEGAGGQLAGQILKAIETGNPAFYQQITKGELETTSRGSDKQEAPTNLNEATVELFNADGTVDRNSVGWTLTRSNRFNPKLDYRKVIGASHIFPSIGKMLSEGSAELFGGDASPEAQNLAKASTSLDALANDFLQFSTNQSKDRVLKFVQEKIEKEVANIRPGGLFLKTDADASAAFQTLSDMVAQQMQIGASILPEYGGKTGNYTEKQVTATRADMDQMKVLMNELLAFQKGFGFVPISRTSSIAGRDQSTVTAKEQIKAMRKSNTGGGVR